MMEKARPFSVLSPLPALGTNPTTQQQPAKDPSCIEHTRAQEKKEKGQFVISSDCFHQSPPTLNSLYPGVIPSVSFCIVPYRSVSFRIIPYRSVSFRIVLYRSVLFFIVPYSSVSFRIILYRSVSFCIVP